MAQRTAKLASTEPVNEAREVIEEIRAAAPEHMTTIPDVVQSLEVMVARRLYEVWRTCGQLTDPKWDWTRQSTNAQHAWRCVARATLPRVQEEHFGPHEIAQVNHG